MATFAGLWCWHGHSVHQLHMQTPSRALLCVCPATCCLSAAPPCTPETLLPKAQWVFGPYSFRGTFWIKGRGDMMDGSVRCPSPTIQEVCRAYLQYLATLSSRQLPCRSLWQFWKRSTLVPPPPSSFNALPLSDTVICHPVLSPFGHPPAPVTVALRYHSPLRCNSALLLLQLSVPCPPRPSFFAATSCLGFCRGCSGCGSGSGDVV